MVTISSIFALSLSVIPPVSKSCSYKTPSFTPASPRSEIAKKVQEVQASAAVAFLHSSFVWLCQLGSLSQHDTVEAFLPGHLPWHRPAGGFYSTPCSRTRIFDCSRSDFVRDWIQQKLSRSFPCELLVGSGWPRVASHLLQAARCSWLKQTLDGTHDRACLLS